ncbi:MAG: hypothetical protein AAF184_22100 [Pseudomonadota bacterium]
MGTAIRDSVIVVLSILLAFAIDAWWDRRGAVDREQALLEAIVTELAAATDDLKQYRDHHARVATAGSQLIGLQGEAAVTPEQADRLLGIIVQGRPYAPSGAVLGSLLGAEGAASLSDPQTALLLARWRQSTSNLAALSDTVAYYLNKDLNAYVNRSIPYRTIDLAAGNVSGIQPSSFPTNVLAQLESVEFENNVYNRYYLATRVVERTDRVLEATGELVSVLKAE